MLGLLVLFAAAAGSIMLAGSAAMWRAIRRPATKGYAWCLAHGRPAEPGELGIRAEERAFPLTRGTTTRGFVMTGQDPDGPLVVFAHGHSASRHYALAVAAPAVRAASRVVLFDMPGHGDADAAVCTLGVREPEDIMAVIEQMDDGTRPVVLFGSSMGAFSALGAAARHAGDRLAGMILLGVFRYGQEPIAGTMRGKGYPAFPFVPLVTLWHRLQAWRETHDRVLDARQVRCPVLLLHCADDPLCPLASARLIADAIPDADLRVFEGDGHTDLWESHPQPYAEAITGFLNRIKKTQPGPPIG